MMAAMIGQRLAIPEREGREHQELQSREEVDLALAPEMEELVHGNHPAGHEQQHGNGDEPTWRHACCSRGERGIDHGDAGQIDRRQPPGIRIGSEVRDELAGTLGVEARARVISVNVSEGPEHA